MTAASRRGATCRYCPPPPWFSPLSYLEYICCLAILSSTPTFTSYFRTPCSHYYCNYCYVTCPECCLQTYTRVIQDHTNPLYTLS
ncbi:Zinc finger, RING-type, conserved site [Parasponia andersonii]|uniref:Zinc finger, RING-type, conserved site n=1 Tax=Parasponia andersonii TaxID=3476 RepID=A0A2P5BJL2_PARAD|nr:Zinc finger, RING-type, conserved site [Parasponia andersonii]